MVYDDGNMGWEEDALEEADATKVEIATMFERLEIDLAERLRTGEHVGVGFEEWVGVEGMSVQDEWSYDWMWGLNANAWCAVARHEEEHVTHENWELWSDLSPGEDLTDQEDRFWYEYLDEDECEALYIEELDETRWANPLETSMTLEGLVRVLEHLDDWDVHVEIEHDRFMDIQEVVVTSLSGTSGTFEGRWTCDESYTPLC